MTGKRSGWYFKSSTSRFSILSFRFPESVKIAVFINGSKRFAVSEEEFSFRFIFVSEIAAVCTEICLDQDPLDIVLFHHRMFHRADLYGDLISAYFKSRNMSSHRHRQKYPGSVPSSFRRNRQPGRRNRSFL